MQSNKHKVRIIIFTTAQDMGSLDGRSFQWSDGSTPNFFNWANGEPNNYQDQEGKSLLED